MCSHPFQTHTHTLKQQTNTQCLNFCLNKKNQIIHDKFEIKKKKEDIFVLIASFADNLFLLDERENFEYLFFLLSLFSLCFIIFNCNY